MVFLLRPVIALLLCSAALVSAVYSPELKAKLANGSPVHGHYVTSHGGHGIRAFTNIPYAEAPVGPLRFADPVPKAPWTEELGVSREMIFCPQNEVFFFDGQYVGQEDCLYLNVYVPMHTKTRGPLPVMLFLHGGGFASGAGNEILYGPEFLVEQDVILVAGNYRLSALGFLSTFTEEFPGNYGMKDQVLMMKWIQQNIAQFGGDPNKVTIFGESAGAGSVGYHLLSPMSKGLFQGAIMHSGSPYENWSNISQAQSLVFAEKMFDVMGCEHKRGDYKMALDCLRAKDSKEFVDNMKHYMVWGHHPVVNFAPVKEVNSKSPFITEADYLSPVNGNEVPVMMGVVANEGAFFAGMVAGEPKLLPQLEENFDELIGPMSYLFDRFDNETMKEKVKLLKQHYFGGENFSWPAKSKGVTDLFSDLTFLPGFNKMMKRRVAGNAKTFAYLFNYRGSASFTDLSLKHSSVEMNLGVSHIDDLLYLFPIVEKVIKFRVMSEEDHKMRKHMVKMWVNFATTGDPSFKNFIWSPVKQFPIDFMRIGNCNLEVCDATSKTTSAMQTGFFEKNIAFMDELYYGVGGAGVGGAKQEL